MARKCSPTERARQILRAMAKAQLEAGVTDAHAIVDAIHARIQDFAPMDKGEIADVISGYGRPRGTNTKSELQQRMGQLKKDLRAAYHGSPKDAARQTAIKKEIAAIEDRLRTRNFTKPSRIKPEYDQKTQALQAELERARSKADFEMKKLEYKARSPLYRATTTALALGRFWILTSPTVFAHLASASAWRVISTLAEDVAGAGWRFMPKVSDIDRMAMLEGGGLQAGAHARGVGAMFSRQTLKDMKAALLKGQTDRDALYGRQGAMFTPHPMLEIAGHVHGAVKVPLGNYAFERAMTRIASNTRAKLARQGMSSDEIDKAFATNTLQSQMTALAYAEEKAAKLQGANKLVDWINETFRRMDRQGAAGQAGAAVLRAQMPILRIPTNLVKEGIELTFGVPTGIVKAFMADLAKLTPAEADRIMRNLKKGTIGPALLAIGWAGYKGMGGLYRSGHKAPSQTEKYGDIGPVSHHLLHAPIAEVAQIGALAHYVYDEDRKYAAQHGEKTSKLSSVLDAAMQGGGAFLMDQPLVEGPQALVEATHGGKGFQHWAGEMGRQYTEPGAFQWLARYQDVDRRGQPNPRKPQSFVDEMKMGIPGLREEVPSRPPRLRKYAKPEE